MRIAEILENKYSALILNSGGFDSTVVMHDIRRIKPEDNLLTVFFDYGQNNVRQEYTCAKKNAEKLGMDFYELTLQPFEWSDSTILEGKHEYDNDEAEYVEMRNMVFLSYALSIAQKLEIKQIFTAFLKGAGFNDTSEKFLQLMNQVFLNVGVTLNLPYSEYEKIDLLGLVKDYKIDKQDYYSCAYPNVNGEPCGHCGKCREIDDLYEFYFKDTLPVHSWISHDLQYSDEFAELFMNEKIIELRFLVNNDCNLSCKHCFYGFNEMKTPELSYYEKNEVLKQAMNYGITNIHIAGKEPLLSKELFEHISFIKTYKADVGIDLVTNGILLEKRLIEIKDSSIDRIFLSIDDFIQKKESIRSINAGISKLLIDLLDCKKSMTIFIDLHKSNYKKIAENINFINRMFGLNEFYIRGVLPIGSANMDMVLNAQEMNQVFEYLLKYTENMRQDTKLQITLYIQGKYTHDFLKDKSNNLMRHLKNYRTTYINEHFSVIPEYYCSPFENTITLTPDGYLLGCATEVASVDYNVIGAGNVRDYSLTELIQRGKQKTLERLRQGGYKGTCHHCL
jgi:7-cyano-7-deazaguanine synthase in queuosine biosynthesis/MoaA/NifB/PqqE/SkfB family radical SAM enzyme